MAGIDYTVKVKVDYEDAANDIIKQLEKVRKEVRDNEIELKFKATKEGITDLINQVQKLHPEIGTSLKLNLDQTEIRKSMKLLEQFIDKSMGSVDIGKNLRKNFSGIKITDKDVKTEIRDKYNKSVSKNTSSDYIKDIYSSIPRLDFSKKGLGFDEIYQAANDIEEAFARLKQIKIIYPDLDLPDYETEFKDFYNNAGKYISLYKKDLKTSLEDTYKQTISDFQEMMKKLGINSDDTKQTVKVGVDPDFDPDVFVADVNEKLKGKKAKVDVEPNIDTAKFCSSIENSLDGSDVKIKVVPDVDANDFKTIIEDKLKDTSIDINVAGNLKKENNDNMPPTKTLNRNPVVIKGDSVNGTMYHGTKSAWTGSDFDFSKAKTAQMGYGMYLTPDIDNVINFGKAEIKQIELDLKKCFIITNDYMSNLEDLYSALGQVLPENATAKTVMSDIRKYNRSSPENSKAFRDKMLEMGYQGMYVGDGLANIKTPIELVIYDENKLKNITSFTNNEFQELKKANPIKIEVDTDNIENIKEELKSDNNQVKNIRVEPELDPVEFIADINSKLDGHKVKVDVEPNIDSEDVSLQRFSNEIIGVTGDVDKKTSAFEQEGQIVSGVIESEINDITALDGWIDTLTKDVKSLSEAMSNSISGDFAGVDDSFVTKIKEINEEGSKLKGAFKDFSEAIKSLNIGKKQLDNIENLSTALGTLSDKFSQFSDEAKGNIASVNELLQNAESLKNLSKVLSSTDSQKKKTKKILNGSDDEEEKVKVNEKYVDRYIANLKKLKTAEKNYKSTGDQSYKLDVDNLREETKKQRTAIDETFNKGDISVDLRNKAADYYDAINTEINNLQSEVKTADQIVDEYINTLKKLETARKRYISTENGRYQLEGDEYDADAEKLWREINTPEFVKNNPDLYQKANDYKSKSDAYIQAMQAKQTPVVDKEAFSDAISGYKELTDNAQRFYNIQLKIANGKNLTFAEQQDLNILAEQYKNAAKAAGIFAEVQTKALNQNDLSDARNRYVEMMESTSKIFSNKLKDAYEGEYETFWNAKDGRPDAYTEVVARLRSQIDELSAKLPLDFADDGSLNDITRINSEIKATIKELNTSRSLQYADENERIKLSSKILNWKNANSAANRDYGGELTSLVDNLKLQVTKQELDSISDSFDKIVMKATEAGKVGTSFGQKLMTKFKDLGAYLLSFVGFYDVINVLKQGVSVVNELDDALTEMRKVSDESLVTLKEYQKESFDTADSIGTTAKALQDSTADWLRLGESFSEAKQSAQDATILMNVSEFSSIDAATESLVAMSQAYDELEKKTILDKLNNIGNNFSISTSGLAEALQKSAAVLKTQSNNIDQAIALITAGGIYIAREYGNIFHRTYLIARTP